MYRSMQYLLFARNRVFFWTGGGGGEGFDILMAFPPTAPLSEGVLRGLLHKHSDLLNISEVFGRNCLAFS